MEIRRPVASSRMGIPSRAHGTTATTPTSRTGSPTICRIWCFCRTSVHRRARRRMDGSASVMQRSGSVPTDRRAPDRLDARRARQLTGRVSLRLASHAMFQHPFLIFRRPDAAMTIRSLGILTVTLLAAPAVYAQDKPDAPAEDYVRAHYTKYEYRIPMRDGVRLFTSVYVPKDQSHPWPIMMDRTPYS